MPAVVPGRRSDDPGRRRALPNVGRVYNCLLGGKDNYEQDRQAARELVAVVPEARAAARANRRFGGRAVRFLAGDAGIGQFLDIGAGLPALGTVGQVALGLDPLARVAYADDPVAVSHARALLCTAPGVCAFEGDLRDPAGIVGQPDLRAVIDLGEPVAVVLGAVLHHVPDEDSPHKLVDMLMAAVAPGSFLVISHATAYDIGPVAAGQVRELYADATAPAVFRSRAEVAGFFEGLELVPPVSATSPPGRRPASGRTRPDACPGRHREEALMRPYPGLAGANGLEAAVYTGGYGLTPADSPAHPAGSQALGVAWPVRPGVVPPLADGFIARPETVPGLKAALVRGVAVALVPGRSSGSAPGRVVRQDSACGGPGRVAVAVPHCRPGGQNANWCHGFPYRAPTGMWSMCRFSTYRRSPAPSARGYSHLCSPFLGGMPAGGVGGAGRGGRRGLVPAGDQAGGFLGDGQHGGVQGGVGDDRDDRGVGDAQPGDPADPQLRVRERVEQPQHRHADQAARQQCMVNTAASKSSLTTTGYDGRVRACGNRWVLHVDQGHNDADHAEVAKAARAEG